MIRFATASTSIRFVELTHPAIRPRFPQWKMAWANRDIAQSRSLRYSPAARLRPRPLDPILERRCLQDPTPHEKRFEKIRTHCAQPRFEPNPVACRGQRHRDGFFLEH